MSWDIFCELYQVGARYRNAHIGKCDKLPEHLIDEGIEWCKKPKSLLIHGSSGRGKTYLTYCLLREAMRLYGLHQIRWVKSKALDDQILQAFSQYGTTTDTIRKFSEINLLFIDDFGVDRGSERTERDYYELIDNRWEHMKPTVITTNLTPEIIEKTYGSRIFSRLKDFKWISFEGLPDLRGENQCR